MCELDVLGCKEQQMAMGAMSFWQHTYLHLLLHTRNHCILCNTNSAEIGGAISWYVCILWWSTTTPCLSCFHHGPQKDICSSNQGVAANPPCLSKRGSGKNESTSSLIWEHLNIRRNTKHNAHNVSVLLFFFFHYASLRLPGSFCPICELYFLLPS